MELRWLASIGLYALATVVSNSFLVLLHLQSQLVDVDAATQQTSGFAPNLHGVCTGDCVRKEINIGSQQKPAT